MINPINLSGFITPGYQSITFRSNSENFSGLNFSRNPRPNLVSDIFERNICVGINGSAHNNSKLIDSLIPGGKIKSLAPGTKETARNKKIEQEKFHLANTVTKRTQQNTAKLHSAGIPDRDIKKYLTIDGHLNTEGKRILREKGISYT